MRLATQEIKISGTTNNKLEYFYHEKIHADILPFSLLFYAAIPAVGGYFAFRLMPEMDGFFSYLITLGKMFGLTAA